MITDYNAIFQDLESSLIRLGSQNAPLETVRRNLDQFKHFEGKRRSDADYYEITVYVAFYSGFRAATVDARWEAIRRNFPDYATVAAYDDERIEQILADPGMIRNRRKVKACVANAKTFKRIVERHGSFQQYLDSFEPAVSFENLMLLKEDLEYRFDGLGRITTYHFLTDIGMPVLKPDRVICRIFRRLGLIDNDEQLLKAVIQGRKFAEATGHPIRYIDIVFVAYGQVQSKNFGLTQGICLEQNPRCSVCGVTKYCRPDRRPKSATETSTESFWRCPHATAEGSVLLS